MNINKFYNQLLTAIGVTTKAKNWDEFSNKFSAGLTSNLKIPVNADVAATGTNLATAAQLSQGFTVVTAADGTKGVKLPATPVAGTVVIVKGTAAAVLKIYPDAAATINAIGSNGAISLASGAVPSIFIAKSSTQWYTIPLLPS